MTTAAMTFYQTSVGKKVVMAVTGLLLLLFVVGHMLGNLQVFLGPEVFNGYAVLLRKMGALLWVVRGALLLAVVLHVVASVQVWLQSRAARPVDYHHKLQHLETSYAARTMRWGGPLLALYVAYHLLHFTFGPAHPEFVPGDVYRNVVIGFQNPIVSGVYVVAMVLLALHVYHGAWSFLQTLGVNHPRINPLRKPVAAGLAALLLVGYCAVPVAVMTGIVK